MADAQITDFPSLFSVKGKVAVVTGGSRGLGLTAASAYVQNIYLSNFSQVYTSPLASQYHPSLASLEHSSNIPSSKSIINPGLD